MLQLVRRARRVRSGTSLPKRSQSAGGAVSPVTPAKTHNPWKFRVFVSVFTPSAAYLYARNLAKENAVEQLKANFLGADESEIRAMTNKARLTTEDLVAVAKELATLGGDALDPDLFGAFVSAAAITAKQKR